MWSEPDFRAFLLSTLGFLAILGLCALGCTALAKLGETLTR